MTLSLDEVRSIRFPMARKPNEDGYRASSVDKFMDELEISYADLVNENEKLKANAGAGEFGTCENCGNPIGKARMEVFPKATMCVRCKQRAERR